MNPKKKNTVFWAMVVLGIVMIALGFLAGPKIILPPIVTGVGFFAIAWGLK